MASDETAPEPVYDLELGITPELWDYAHRVLALLPPEVDPLQCKDAIDFCQTLVDVLEPLSEQDEVAFDRADAALALVRELLKKYSVRTFFSVLETEARQQRSVQSQRKGPSTFWAQQARADCF